MEGPDIVLDDPPTPGNVLVLWHACRDTRKPIAPMGFSSHPDGTVAAQFSSGNDQDNGRWFYRVVESGDSDTIEDVIDDTTGVSQNGWVGEYTDVGEVAFGPSMSLQNDDPIESDLFTLDADAVALAGVVWFQDSTIDPDSGVTERKDEMLEGTFHPTSWVGEITEDETAGPLSIRGLPNDSTADGWGLQVLVLYGTDTPEPPPVDPGYTPPGVGNAILEIYVHDEDATRWGTATWSADAIPTGTEGIWSGAGWQDVTPQGVTVHVITGARRPERGILAQQEAASWLVTTYDPDRVLDPGNPDGPYAPQLVSGVPIRVRSAHSGTVAATGVIDRISYRHRGPEYRGTITATDAIALAHRADVPEDSTLGDTLDLRIRDAIIAAEISTGGIPLQPSSVPAIDLSPRIEGEASLWDHIRRAGEEVFWVPYVDKDGGFEIRPWGGPLDRGRTLTFANLEDLEASSSEDGVYSVVRVNNADGSAIIERVAAPLPRYGRIVYERDETTIDPESWADALLADRAWPGIRYVPGTVWCFTAADVEYMVTMETLELVTIVAPGFEVSGRLLGMEFWIEQRAPDRARWLFLPYIATAGAAVIGGELLVDDDDGEYLVDDDDGDYLEAD
jgi:hypothetical protein